MLTSISVHTRCHFRDLFKFHIIGFSFYTLWTEATTVVTMHLIFPWIFIWSWFSLVCVHVTTTLCRWIADPFVRSFVRFVSFRSSLHHSLSLYSSRWWKKGKESNTKTQRHTKNKLVGLCSLFKFRRAFTLFGCFFDDIPKCQ